MKRRSLLALFAIISLCAGCAHLEGYLDIPKYKGVSKEYLECLELWSRAQTVYSEFETMVYIKATYKGPEFTKSYMKEYARIYHLDDAEQRKREEATAEFSSQYMEFFFYAYTPEKESNDFDKVRSVWSVYLVDEEGKRFSPLELRKIEKVTPLITSFYPYVNQYYGMCYTVKFPALSTGSSHMETGQKRRIKLVFTSVLAKVVLEWIL